MSTWTLRWTGGAPEARVQADGTVCLAPIPGRFPPRIVAAAGGPGKDAGRVIRYGLSASRDGSLQVVAENDANLRILPAMNSLVRGSLKVADVHFRWNALQFNVNAASMWYSDDANLGLSLVGAFGEFTGGELEFEGRRPSSSTRPR